MDAAHTGCRLTSVHTNARRQRVVGLGRARLHLPPPLNLKSLSRPPPPACPTAAHGGAGVCARSGRAPGSLLERPRPADASRRTRAGGGPNDARRASAVCADGTTARVAGPSSHVCGAPRGTRQVHVRPWHLAAARYVALASELLSTLKKTEDSLLRLKRTKKKADGTDVADGVAGPAPAAITDEAKVRLQLWLDVQQYAAEVRGPPVRLAWRAYRPPVAHSHHRLQRAKRCAGRSAAAAEFALAARQTAPVWRAVAPGGSRRRGPRGVGHANPRRPAGGVGAGRRGGAERVTPSLGALTGCTV